jgi:hypothetical protein
MAVDGLVVRVSGLPGELAVGAAVDQGGTGRGPDQPTEDLVAGGEDVAAGGRRPVAMSMIMSLYLPGIRQFQPWNRYCIVTVNSPNWPPISSCSFIAYSASCRPRYPRPVTWGLWLQAELVAMATDLAEFVGAAVALNLLFGVPLLPAGIITAGVTFALLSLRPQGRHRFEAVIIGMLGIILAGFLYQACAAGSPDHLAAGLLPGLDGGDGLLLATGIVGATVMPHAVYLHSDLSRALRCRDLLPGSTLPRCGTAAPATERVRWRQCWSGVSRTRREVGRPAPASTGICGAGERCPRRRLTG